MNEALKNEENKKVQDYEFKALNLSNKKKASSEKVEFKKFDDQIKKVDHFSKTIKEERGFAKENRFEVSPIVQNFRGLKDQEDREIADMIELEVSNRFAEIKEKGFQEGFNKGKEEGLEQVKTELSSNVEEKLEKVSEIIVSLQQNQYKVIEKQKTEIYTFVKNLTKWITLKELNEDGAYLERLLEKLILETQSKNNLLIQVNTGFFEQMPEVLALVEKKLGALTNVRIEVDKDVQSYGMILESENGIVNATLEQQFLNLDKLFEVVGVKEAIEEESDEP